MVTTNCLKRRIILFVVCLVLLFPATVFGIGEVFTPSVPGGQEKVELGVKFSNYSNVISSTLPTLSCSWKPDAVDDGWKSCEAIFDIANHASLAPLITNPAIVFNFLSNATRNQVVLFSNTYTIINETYLNDTGGNVTRILFPRRRFSNFVNISQIDTSLPFAIKIMYDAPKFAGNQFNLSISAANFNARIDPNQSSCGSLSSPGIYTIIQNVSNGGTCIIISSNNVTLDCQGYTINYATSTQGYGVINSGYNRTTVKNCVIQKRSGFNSTNHGIYFSGNANGTIYNNAISTNGTNDNDGIFLSSSNTNNVTDNTIITSGSGGNNVGILLSGTNLSNNLIYNNIINTSGAYSNGGISLNPSDAESSKGNNITGNVIRTSGTGTISGNKGIYVTNADDCIILNNTITTNSSSSSNNGIEISSGNAENISVQYNQVTTNGNSDQNYGLYVNSAHGNLFTENIFITNGTSLNYGAWFLAADNNTFSSNTIRASGASIINYGVYTSQGSDNNTFASNTVTTETSSSDGIRISEAQNTSITNNTIETLGASSKGITVTGSAWNYAALNSIRSNTINSSGANSKGVSIEINASNNSIESNSITATLMGVSISNNSGVGNLFLNNNFSNANYIISDESSNATLNYLIYNNSFGQIMWTNTAFQANLTLNISNYDGFGLGKNLFIGNNTVGLNTSAFTSGGINSSADISLYSLPFNDVMEIFRLETFSNNSSQITVNGADCNGVTCSILSYNNSSGTLLFNTTSFSSFAASQSNKIDVSNTSLVYSNASGYAVFRFFITNNDNSSNMLNWSFDTNRSVVYNVVELNLSVNETAFVFIENNYSSIGNYLVQANSTAGTSADNDIANITVG